MPPKKQITKEGILTGALELFRKRGADALCARELAKHLGCSTQPIYLSFSGMEELKEALSARMWEIYTEFIRREMLREDVPPNKASGLGYIRFAREEPKMFQYLFMRPRTSDEQSDGGSGVGSFAERVAFLQRSFGFSKEDATRFHMEQWVFVHGIASMLATSYLSLDEDTVSQMMTDIYTGLWSVYLGKEHDDERN